MSEKYVDTAKIFFADEGLDLTFKSIVLQTSAHSALFYIFNSYLLKPSYIVRIELTIKYK